MSWVSQVSYLALVSSQIPRLVNFLIFVVAVFLLLRKPLARFFHERATKIRHELAQARSEREEAAAKLQEITSRLENLDQDIQQLKAHANTEADAEQARIAAAARVDAEKIQELARREIDSAVNAARLELKAFAAQQAVTVVAEILRREINNEDHHRLIERFGEQMREVRR